LPFHTADATTADARSHTHNASRTIPHHLINLKSTSNFKRTGLQVMYAVTDGFSGLNGGWDTPGTGLNFLAHNMVGLSSVVFVFVFVLVV
jgi:hypothetical protein